MASATPERNSKWAGSIAVGLPVTPIAVRFSPGIAWARNPSVSMTCRTFSISSDVASDFITINISVYSCCIYKTTTLLISWRRRKLGKKAVYDPVDRLHSVIRRSLDLTHHRGADHRGVGIPPYIRDLLSC